MSKQIFENKIVSIIGSSGEIEENDYSEIISKSDFVVRINTRILDNKLYLPPQVVKNTTNRMDVCCHSGQMLGEKISAGHKTYITNTECCCFTEKNFNIYYQNNIKIFMFPSHRFNRIKHDFSHYEKDLDIKLIKMEKEKSYDGSCLTTGINCINEICMSDPKQIYIFGFDCYKGKKVNYTNYVEIGVPKGQDIKLYETKQNQNYGSHNHNKELKFLYGICVKNNIIIQKHLLNIFKQNNFDVSKLNVYKSNS